MESPIRRDRPLDRGRRRERGRLAGMDEKLQGLLRIEQERSTFFFGRPSGKQSFRRKQEKRHCAEGWPVYYRLSLSVHATALGAYRRSRSGFERLVLRLVGVRLHRRYTAISPASPSLPVTKPLALGPTTGFFDRLLVSYRVSSGDTSGVWALSLSSTY